MRRRGALWPRRCAGRCGCWRGWGLRCRRRVPQVSGAVATEAGGAAGSGRCGGVRAAHAQQNRIRRGVLGRAALRVVNDNKWLTGSGRVAGVAAMPGRAFPLALRPTITGLPAAICPKTDSFHARFLGLACCGTRYALLETRQIEKTHALSMRRSRAEIRGRSSRGAYTAEGLTCPNQLQSP
jgi:hypothetical protein